MTRYYKYHFIDKSGKRRKGYTVDTSQKRAMKKLRGSVGGNVIRVSRILMHNKIKIADLITWSSMIYHMLEGKFLLYEALDRSSQSTNNAMRAILHDIRYNIYQGSTLLESCKMHTKVFDPVMLCIISVGEKSGHISDAFMRMKEYLENKHKRLAERKMSLRYPIASFLFMIGIASIISRFIGNEIINFFQEASMTPPKTTILFINIMSSMQVIIPWIVTLSLLAILLNNIMKQKSIAWKRKVNGIFLRMPIVGCLSKYEDAGHGFQLISFLINHKIGVVEAMSLVRKQSKNQMLADAWESLISQAMIGKSIFETASKQTIFPKYTSQILEIGEKSGNLHESFRRIGLMLEESADSYRKSVLLYAQPIILLLTATVVMTIFGAMMMPIYYSIADFIV